MKKASKLFVVLALFACTLLTTSCALFDRLGELVGPKNQWKVYEYVYTSGEQKIVLDCWMLYTENEYNGKTFYYTAKDTDAKTKYEFVNGLNLFIVPNVGKTKDANASITDEALQGLIGSVLDDSVVIKPFTNGEDAKMNTAGDDLSAAATEKTFKMGYITWAVIYNSIATKNGTPPFLGQGLASDKVYKEMDFSNIKDFSFKKLMAVWAYNKLDKYLEENN